MDQLTNVFKILSDETRLRIILLLFQSNLCVGEISGILDVPQPRVSKNLSKLRDLNLVVDERKEKFVFYSLRKDQKYFIQLIQGILENIEDYPQIKTDSERIKDKEQYFNQCCGVGE
jgi:ArsR family transcriptional regulator